MFLPNIGRGRVCGLFRLIALLRIGHHLRQSGLPFALALAQAGESRRDCLMGLLGQAGRRILGPRLVGLDAFAET